jgi:hypothetical protein
MPREVVYGDGVPYGTPEEPGPARTIVEVSWSRGSHVQVATRCVRAVDSGTVYEAQPGEPGADEDLAGQGIPRAFGVFTGLDRQGINLLIKNLRRARDQAFGRDE